VKILQELFIRTGHGMTLWIVSKLNYGNGTSKTAATNRRGFWSVLEWCYGIMKQIKASARDHQFEHTKFDGAIKNYIHHKEPKLWWFYYKIL
jgi:hypothetical protein